MKITGIIILLIISIITIISVCLQTPKERGLSAGIAGGSGVSSKNRKYVRKGFEQKLSMLTGITGAAFIGLSVVLIILL